MQDDASISDTLISRLRRRDDGAWERVCELYLPLLHYWCRRAGVPEDDCHDLVQDVLLGVSQRIDSFFRDEGGSFRGWLRVITRNRVADHFARKARTPPTADLAALDLAAPPELDALELGCLTRRALELVARDCEPRSLQIFRALMLEDADPAALASQHQLSVGAVYQTKYRIIRRLRAELAELDS